MLTPDQSRILIAIQALMLQLTQHANRQNAIVATYFMRNQLYDGLSPHDFNFDMSPILLAFSSPMESDLISNPELN